MLPLKALGVLVLLCAQAAAEPRVENFRLLDHSGVARELYRLCGKKAVVLFVHGNGCPIVQKTLPTLRALNEKFAPLGAQIWLLNANTQDTQEAIAEAAKAAGLDLPVLIDDSQAIARSLGITRTGEALLIDPRGWRLVYRGAVDDRLYYGAEKPRASARYLEEALEALLGGRKPPRESTEAFGCLIHFEKTKPDPTYVADVAPILKAKCLRCHASPSGPAPLTGYAMARGWSAMLRETIRTGLMPPNVPDPAVGRFKNDPGLTPAEKRTLLAWVESSLARGEGPDPLQGAARGERFAAGKPDLVYAAEVPNVPEGPRPFRFVTLDPALDRDLWISGALPLTVGPDAGKLHHNVVVLRPEDPQDLLERTTIADMTGLADERGHNPYLLHLSPFNSGTAVQFAPKGSRLILKIHYPFASTTKPGMISYKMGLYFAARPDPARTLRARVIHNRSFRIPSGHPAYEVEAVKELPRAIRLVCLNFHVHRRAASLKVSARKPGGGVVPILSVPVIDYHSPQTYCLDKPLQLPSRTSVTAKVIFDNSPQNRNNPDPAREVPFGFEEENEMMEVYLHHTLAAAAEPSPTGANLRQ